MKFGAGISSGLSNVIGYALTAISFGAAGGPLGAWGMTIAAFTGGGLLAKYITDDQRADFEKQIRDMCKRMEDQLRLDARFTDSNNQEAISDLLNSLPKKVSSLGLTADQIIANDYDATKVADDLVRRLALSDAKFAPETFLGGCTHKILSAAFDSVKGAEGFIERTTLEYRERVLADLGVLQDELSGLSAGQAEIIELLHQQKGVPLEPMKSHLIQLGADPHIDVSQVPEFLKRFADDYIKMETRLARDDQTSPSIQALRDAARSKMQAGDLDGASSNLTAARKIRCELRETGAREEALLLEDLAGIDGLQLNHSEAADKYAEAAVLVSFDDGLKAYYLECQFRALYDLGNEFGDNQALGAAIALMSERILPHYSQSESGEHWADLQNSLGIALRTLGEREGGTARLESALDAFNLALLERQRETAPFEWAQTQNNLGNVLSALGVRASRTRHWSDAVEAYKNALLEFKRDRVPFEWGTAQNNLGIALQMIGDRESSIPRLEDSIQAYEMALLELRRERFPLDWAMVQSNLSGVLMVLGKLEKKTVRFEAAVKACNQALLERTRERVPLAWAMTQHNLGLALRYIGELDSGVTHLKDAVNAFENALLERTRDRVRLDWAGTQNGLGYALWLIGKRESGTAQFEAAIRAYEQALIVFAEDGFEHFVNVVRIRLAQVRLQLNLRKGISMSGVIIPL